MAAIPEGFHTVVPSLTVSDARGAIALYEAAFGARSMGVMAAPDGKRVLHAMIMIGTSRVFLNDEIDGMTRAAPTGAEDGANFYLYLEDIDAAHARAVKAGMSEKYPPSDMFWGDRVSVVTDRYGQIWTLASHMRDVSPEEMAQAAKTFGA